MNKDWADKNKRMQSLIGKEASFREGLDVLFDLRGDLFGQITSIVNTFPAEAFYQMPFAGATDCPGRPGAVYRRMAGKNEESAYHHRQ